MLINRLSALTCQLTKRSLLQRVISRSNTQSTLSENKKSNDDEDENDKPIPYSKSPAAEWQAKFSQRGYKEDVPEYQGLIVVISFMTFYTYFVHLREANDIDEIFERELGDYFPDLKVDDVKRKLPPEVATKRVS